MEIQLKQQHIEAAIRDYMTKAGITFDVDEINFTQTRGKDGLTASVALADPFAAMLDKAAGDTPAAKSPRKTGARTLEAKESEQAAPEVKAEVPDAGPAEAAAFAETNGTGEPPFEPNESDDDGVAAEAEAKTQPEAKKTEKVSLFG